MKALFLASLLASGAVSTAGVPEHATLVDDYNGDGVLDYTLDDSDHPAGRNTLCFVYLSDARGKHHKVDLEVANAIWDPKQKTLTSSFFGGGGRTYVSRTYRFSSLRAVPIRIEQRTEREVDGNGNLEFTTTIKTLVKGRWTTTVKHE